MFRGSGNLKISLGFPQCPLYSFRFMLNIPYPTYFTFSRFCVDNYDLISSFLNVIYLINQIEYDKMWNLIIQDVKFNYMTIINTFMIMYNIRHVI